MRDRLSAMLGVRFGLTLPEGKGILSPATQPSYPRIDANKGAPARSEGAWKRTRIPNAATTDATTGLFSIPDPFADEKIWEVYGWVL